jgi:multicomponent Na+:H+ antiporter subunit C
MVSFTYLMDGGLYQLALLQLGAGLFIVLSAGSLLRKLLGLGLLQSAVFLFFVSMGKMRGGTVPLVAPCPGVGCGALPTPALYANPVPHVLMLTAIVVGVATLALGLALLQRLKAYGSSTEDV